jgi:DNA-binding response OmpR family regulator
MLTNCPHKIGLSLVANSAPFNTLYVMQNHLRISLSSMPAYSSTEPENSSLISLPQKKEIQLAAFGGLLILFLVMVALLFRRYKNRRSTRKDSLSDNLWKADNLSFTPTVFSSDSSPAILVAQHDSDLRLFITNTLRLNYRVIGTSHGEEAFDKAFEMVPDLIITARLMPGLDGPRLCRKVKTTDVTSHIPVILLDDGQDALAHPHEWPLYADDYLPKTFDARELLMRVHKLILDRKKIQEDYRKNPARYEVTKPTDHHENPFMLKLMTVLENYYSDPLFGVEQLTDQLQMSRLQLFRKLKALTSYSPGEFIRYYRLEQAKNFLSTNEMSVTDVAFKTGFTNPTGFARSFKDYTGKTPLEFSLEKNPSGQSLVED